MNPLIQFRTTMLPILITSVLACFGFIPLAQAVVTDPQDYFPNYNTAVGQNALLSLTTGVWNTALGGQALNRTTTGNNNTAVGLNALYFNTNSDNTALGTEALKANNSGNGNTAAGSSALHINTTGGANVAVGFLALDNNTSGTFNTAVGKGALSGGTGNSNTALGHQAGIFHTTGDGNVYIGQGMVGFANETNHTYIRNIYGTNVGAARIVRVFSNGLLGTFEASSRRFKDDIKPMDKASEAILALKPVTFHYKKEQDATGGALQYGLVAEEVEKVMPELVYRDERGEVDGVKYESINMMLLNEFLKEHRKVEE